jgi:hypothetical protein
LKKGGIFRPFFLFFALAQFCPNWAAPMRPCSVYNIEQASMNGAVAACNGPATTATTRYLRDQFNLL